MYNNSVKQYQRFSVWLLPLIVIGGWFYPLLGFLVVAMMAYFIPSSYFFGRAWCRYFCPRGAFLDLAMPVVSAKKPLPAFFRAERFRAAVMAPILGFLGFRLWQTGGNLLLVGAVFVLMCTLTTIFGILIGIYYKPRGWCVICPMGYIQELIGRTAGKR